MNPINATLSIVAAVGLGFVLCSIILTNKTLDHEEASTGLFGVAVMAAMLLVKFGLCLSTYQ